MEPFELRVEGEPGVMDAGQVLRVLTLLTDVAGAVAPRNAALPLAGLSIGSATATITPADVTVSDLGERVQAAFDDPNRLDRQIRSDLSEAFRTRHDYGIDGFGYRVSGTLVPFDQATYRRAMASLVRPSSWTSVTGEVRSVGRAVRGVSGRITNRVSGRVVNFDAPDRLDDALRETLFRRATLSGPAELDDDGTILSVHVERLEALGPAVRLSDLDFSDVTADAAASHAVLREMRGG